MWSELDINGPRSLGRGHHVLYFCVWSELERVTGESNVNRLDREEKSGPRSLCQDHQSGPRSLGRDHRGPRLHVSPAEDREPI